MVWVRGVAGVERFNVFFCRLNVFVEMDSMDGRDGAPMGRRRCTQFWRG